MALDIILLAVVAGAVAYVLGGLVFVVHDIKSGPTGHYFNDKVFNGTFHAVIGLVANALVWPLVPTDS